MAMHTCNISTEWGRYNSVTRVSQVSQYNQTKQQQKPLASSKFKEKLSWGNKVEKQQRKISNILPLASAHVHATTHTINLPKRLSSIGLEKWAPIIYYSNINTRIKADSQSYKMYRNAVSLRFQYSVNTLTSHTKLLCL